MFKVTHILRHDELVTTLLEGIVGVLTAEEGLDWRTNYGHEQLHICGI